MHCHLVTVEVGVECRTYERVKLYCLTFDKYRLKRLDTESVKGWCTVEHYGMFFDDILEHIPNFGTKPLNHLLCVLDIVSRFVRNKLLHNERLEQLYRHLLRETALIYLKFGTYDDNRTARIVNSLSEKVLTETSGLTFEHVGKGLKGSVTGSRYGTSATSVINKRINSFLKHSLLVADDDVRSSELKESLQTVITVDDPSVQIVKVTCGESSAVKLYHGTKIRRDNRDDIHYHPLGLVSGFTECFDNFKSLNDLCLLLAGRLKKLGFQLFSLTVKIYRHQEFLDGLGTHSDTELAVSVLFALFLILGLGKYLLVLKVGRHRIEDYIVCKIQDFLKCSR